MLFSAIIARHFFRQALHADVSPLNLLSCSIVSFRSEPDLLQKTLASLAAAVRRLPRTQDDASAVLYLVDNTDDGELSRIVGANDPWRAAFAEVILIAGHGNVGYGAGHNLAIARADSAFHLVLNPDVELDDEALEKALPFLQSHPETVLLAPRVVNQRGELQFLCRRVPSVLDLLLRGFAPRPIRQLFRRRLEHYVLFEAISQDKTFWDPPLVSGCFMLFRTQPLQRLGGFDSAFFLYFEDYDLSLRTSRLGRLVYWPDASIVHHGGGASRKGWAHIRMFCASAARFFRIHGWRLF